MLVLFRVRRLFLALPPTEHEMTPLLVFFHVRLLFFTLPHTKRHPCNHVGVILCLAFFTSTKPHQ